MILVTGATGFVGRALLDDLAVRGLAFRAVSRRPLDGFLDVGEFTAATDWREALAGIDTIIHLAARTHVMHETESDPLAAYRALNVEATVNLAEQAVLAGVRRFVFLSSIKVNGEETPPGRPFTEDMPPAPEDAYGQTKLEAEAALFALGRRSGMEITVIRPPLVYGAGVGANFERLMRLALKGWPLPFGRTRNARSLIYVGNLTDLLCRAATQENAANAVFLAADDEAPSTGALVTRIARAAGKPAPKLLPVPLFAMRLAAGLIGRGAIARRLFGSLVVDAGKAKRVLGWAPPFSLDEGLRRTVEVRSHM